METTTNTEPRESDAARQRRHLRERAAYIAFLGMAPENSQRYEDRYAYTTGEFARDVRREQDALAVFFLETPDDA